MKTSCESTGNTTLSKETQQFLLLTHIQNTKTGIGRTTRKRGNWTIIILASFAIAYFGFRMAVA